MKWILALLALPMIAGAAEHDKGIDNTRQNLSEQVTAQDQGDSRTDLLLTAKIREAVMADPALSLTAQNVKIVTQGGKVTLAGPVKTADEKTAIGNLAGQIAGKDNVNNTLKTP